jgi:hypothetical protein
VSKPTNVTDLRQPKKAAEKKPKPIPDNAVSVRMPQMCAMLGIGPTKAAELIRTKAVESTLLGKTRLISVRSIKALIPGEAA